MVTKKMVCMSCGMDITNARGSLRAPCPSCLDQEIIRCYSCRRIAAKYTCQKCNFVGPN